MALIEILCLILRLQLLCHSLYLGYLRAIGMVRALLPVDDLVDAFRRQCYFLVNLETVAVVVSEIHVMVVLDHEIVMVGVYSRGTILIAPNTLLRLKCFKFMKWAVRLVHELECVELRASIVPSFQVKLAMVVILLGMDGLHLLTFFKSAIT